jgi:NADPH-dependent curcumin reductase
MANERKVWRLINRPQGDIKDTDLALQTEPMPVLKDGEILIRTIYLSLDPTNRIWMSDMEQYMPPVGVGDGMRGGVVGEVVASKNPKFKEGEVVGGLGEWASHYVSDGAMLSQIPPIPGVPLAAVFGVLGMISATAYFGLMDITHPKAGETVVVSGAAGAVGSLVGQIAKMQGCRVIGIAGSAEKCRWITEELGFDGAINYKTENVGARLDALAPNGIDINFENVGGDIMEAVMARMNIGGRMSLCGMISQYNSTEPLPGPKTWPLILMKRLKVQGFIVTDYGHRFPEAAMAVVQGMLQGKIKYRLDIRQGLENAVVSVRDLFTGANSGKLMVQVGPEPGVA